MLSSGWLGRVDTALEPYPLVNANKPPAARTNMGNKLEVPMVDLSSKVAIVTGGNTGIGYELVKGLAEMGAHTIMATRSEERASDVRIL